jgi:hypothetical protein
LLAVSPATSVIDHAGSVVAAGAGGGVSAMVEAVGAAPLAFESAACAGMAVGAKASPLLCVCVVLEGELDDVPLPPLVSLPPPPQAARNTLKNIATKFRAIGESRAGRVMLFL